MSKTNDEESLADKDQLPENMAERIEPDWGDPAEPGESPLWFVLLFILLIFLSGAITGAYILGWRPF